MLVYIYNICLDIWLVQQQTHHKNPAKSLYMLYRNYNSSI